MRYEVRCCCDCSLLGYLDIDHELRPGQTYVAPMRTPVRFETWHQAPVAELDARALSFEYTDYGRTYFLPGGEPMHHRGMALKSRDYLRSDLERIAGFIPRSR